MWKYSCSKTKVFLLVYPFLFVNVDQYPDEERGREQRDEAGGDHPGGGILEGSDLFLPQIGWKSKYGV